MTHNDMDNSKELLSATRGNAFGFMFFRILLKCFGVRIAGAFLWPVTFFYALFDRTACRRARPVLECMYPEASVLVRFWHTWRLFANQGRVILLANYLSATGKEIPVVTENHPEALPYIQSGEHPVVVVSSHFGAWQVAFINSHLIHRNITFLDHPDQKATLDKFQTVRAEEGQVAEIAPDLLMILCGINSLSDDTLEQCLIEYDLLAESAADLPGEMRIVIQSVLPADEV